ncbi:MAG: excisionase family DNA-binding protein [Bacteroidetes bacterium]|nr:excisionase family DNA-binding protein [Bacteroidota bacterium]
MAIDLSTYKAQRPVRSRKQEEEAGSPAPLPSATVEKKLEDLRKQFPDKHLFSIREASDVLSVDYETVRKAVTSGKIYSVPFGSVRRIQIETLAEALVLGIPK